MNYEPYNSILQFIPQNANITNLYLENLSQSILEFIQENNLTKVLVSLSGGVDSMVMTLILKSLNIDFESEKQIDLLALWISKKRIQIPEIKEKWNKLKNYRLEDWPLHSEELDDYIKNLNIWSKEELYNEALELFKS